MQEKPILRFVSAVDHYKLYNMGKGIADGIIIGRIAAGKERIIENIDEPTVKAYSLPQNAQIKVDWGVNSGVLYAFYTDYLGEPYLVTCIGDENSDEYDEAVAGRLIRTAYRRPGLQIELN